MTAVAPRVGVVGAGTLGRTVALAALGADSAVTVLIRGDARRCAVLAEHLRAAVMREVDRGRLHPDLAAPRCARLRVTNDAGALGDAEVVVESVPEDLARKQVVLATIEDVVASDTVIASSTSTIPAGMLSAGARRPERIVVAHYVWPAHRMPLVEVAMHPQTSAAAAATLDRLLAGQHKTQVRVADRPGFLITRALFAYWNAALELLAAGLRPDEVDDAHLAWGWPMGPVDLMWRTGLASVERIHAGVAPALGHRFAMLARLGTSVEATLAAVRECNAPVVPTVDPVRHTVGALGAEVELAVAEGVVASWQQAGSAIDLAYGFPAMHGGLHRWWHTHLDAALPQPV